MSPTGLSVIRKPPSSSWGVISLVITNLQLPIICIIQFALCPASRYNHEHQIRGISTEGEGYKTEVLDNIMLYVKSQIENLNDTDGEVYLLW